MDPYALLSLLLFSFFIATLLGMATGRLTHRNSLYFALIFLGASLLAYSNSTFSGEYGKMANLIATLLFIGATLGMFFTKTKKSGEPTRPDVGQTGRNQAKRAEGKKVAKKRKQAR